MNKNNEIVTNMNTNFLKLIAIISMGAITIIKTRNLVLNDE